MAVYLVGDIQGCFRTFERLLLRIAFNPAQDRLWLAGDLVNRGPRSLEVLRFVRGLGTAAQVVLGNHDLHLIGRALGVRRAKPRDTLERVLTAPDCDSLIDWLQRQPLLYREGALVLVHAGLLPDWSVSDAETLAREAEAALRGTAAAEVLDDFRGRAPNRWRDDLPRMARIRLALKTFTLLRTCSRDGKACADFSGPPDQAPKGCHPWFDITERRSADATVVCGHWAALGLRLQPGLIALDTGCVWGGSLTAVRVSDRAVFQEPLGDPM
jgi:bis(5'-nucleosyl)-tetraphosphatase (symmetrical)